jgi:hypothetical protein
MFGRVPSPLRSGTGALFLPCLLSLTFLCDCAETPALSISHSYRNPPDKKSRQLFDELSKRWFPLRLIRSVEATFSEIYERQAGSPYRERGKEVEPACRKTGGWNRSVCRSTVSSCPCLPLLFRFWRYPHGRKGSRGDYTISARGFWHACCSSRYEWFLRPVYASFARLDIAVKRPEKADRHGMNRRQNYGPMA